MSPRNPVAIPILSKAQVDKVRDASSACMQSTLRTARYVRFYSLLFGKFARHRSTADAATKVVVNPAERWRAPENIGLARISFASPPGGRVGARDRSRASGVARAATKSRTRSRPDPERAILTCASILMDFVFLLSYSRAPEPVSGVRSHAKCGDQLRNGHSNLSAIGATLTFVLFLSLAGLMQLVAHAAAAARRDRVAARRGRPATLPAQPHRCDPCAIAPSAGPPIRRVASRPRCL